MFVAMFNYMMTRGQNNKCTDILFFISYIDYCKTNWNVFIFIAIYDKLLEGKSFTLRTLGH